MAKYAENTTVPVERSKAEIEKILVRYGTDQFMYATDVRKAIVMFRANNRLIRFIIPMPDPKDNELIETPTGRSRSESATILEYEKEVKRRWRALLLSIKGKLEAVESGIMTFEEEFMANIVLPDNKTVAEFMLPQIQMAYETKNMPKMLPYLES